MDIHGPSLKTSNINSNRSIKKEKETLIILYLFVHFLFIFYLK